MFLEDSSKKMFWFFLQSTFKILPGAPSKVTLEIYWNDVPGIPLIIYQWIPQWIISRITLKVLTKNFTRILSWVFPKIPLKYFQRFRSIKFIENHLRNFWKIYGRNPWVILKKIFWIFSERKPVGISQKYMEEFEVIRTGTFGKIP